MEKKVVDAYNTPDPFPLSGVTMPLIRVMVDARLSWSERMTIAHAVNQCVVEWHCLMSEHQRHLQSSLGGKPPTEAGDATPPGPSFDGKESK